MPEIRYTEVFDGKGNLMAKEPYEVSDEEIEEERERQRAQEILGKGGFSQSEAYELLTLVAKRMLGFRQ